MHGPSGSLAAALADESLVGLWGGTDDRERREMRRRAARWRDTNVTQDSVKRCKRRPTFESQKGQSRRRIWPNVLVDVGRPRNSCSTTTSREQGRPIRAR